MPHTLGMLLATLRLGRADEHTRRVEIGRRLQSNVPSRRLARSLERRGYGDLLP